MPESARTRLRVAAIDFLNPAPLLYDFEHSPTREVLAQRYEVRYTSPAECAEQLRTGEADLGLVPIAAMPFLPDVTAVPGCVIASPGPVRSIQLVLRPGVRLETVRSIAADTASRSSTAYVQTLLRAFHGNDPVVAASPADLSSMLQDHDAALLIGDPALLALQTREQGGTFADCTWIDVASWWHEQTGLPWVAAVWAVRTTALQDTSVSANVLENDLSASRDDGLAHVNSIVEEWRSRIALPPAVVREYLTRNIHYTLDNLCLLGIERFYTLAEQAGTLRPYRLPML